MERGGCWLRWGVELAGVGSSWEMTALSFVRVSEGRVHVSITARRREEADESGGDKRRLRHEERVGRSEKRREGQCGSVQHYSLSLSKIC